MEYQDLYIPVVIALTQLAKKYISTDWIPVVSLIVGVILAGLVMGFEVASIVEGIKWGLMAVGLYSGTKTIGRTLGRSFK